MDEKTKKNLDDLLIKNGIDPVKYAQMTLASAPKTKTPVAPKPQRVYGYEAAIEDYTDSRGVPRKSFKIYATIDGKRTQWVWNKGYAATKTFLGSMDDILGLMIKFIKEEEARFNTADRQPDAN